MVIQPAKIIIIFGRNPGGPKNGKGTNKIDATKPTKLADQKSGKICLNRIRRRKVKKGIIIKPIPEPKTAIIGKDTARYKTQAKPPKIAERISFLVVHI